MSNDDDVGGAGHVKPAIVADADELLRLAVRCLQELRYPNYLRTEHWLDFREGALLARPFCQVCETAESKQVHHLTYDYLGRERMEDVLVLCASCHQKWHDEHKGESLSTPADDLSWAGRTRRFGRH